MIERAKVAPQQLITDEPIADARSGQVGLSEQDALPAPPTKADLSGADLSYANLSYADLRGADLAGARLVQANLTGADLTDANLAGADLRGALISPDQLKRARTHSGAKGLG